MSENKGHAVYDETLERFVGGVHDTAKAAEDAAGAAPDGHKFTTRKV